MNYCEINEAIVDFDRKYGKEDNFINLIIRVFPNNNDYKHVLLKVCIINELYSAGIKDEHIRIMAKRIYSIKDIDQKIYNKNKDDIDAFYIIAEKADGLNNYAVFASKYCHFHNPDKFPIFDKNSRKALAELNNKGFSVKDLEEYKSYKACIDGFLRGLGNKYNYKQIDEFLWLKGKGLLGKCH